MRLEVGRFVGLHRAVLQAGAVDVAMQVAIETDQEAVAVADDVAQAPGDAASVAVPRKDIRAVGRARDRRLNDVRHDLDNLASRCANQNRY